MNREDCKVGMDVTFGYENGEKTLGKVIKINQVRAKVQILEERGQGHGGAVGKTWGVPYSMMEPVSKSTTTKPAVEKTTTKTLKCIYHVYKNSKRIGDEEIVIERAVKSPVSIPSVNKVFEKIDDEVGKTIRQRGDGSYPVLYSYNKVETDKDIPCYCWICKKPFSVKEIYGVSLTKPQCPKGHTKTSDKNYGKCHKCKQGLMWQTRAVSGGRECMIYHIQCDTCRHQDSVVID